jgi:flagellar biosynthesis/type III secretory pathway M-ring protein FliF/YscJ
MAVPVSADLMVRPVFGPDFTDVILVMMLGIIALFIVYLMIRELRVMRTSMRAIEHDIEREKLQFLEKEALSQASPFSRMTSEQISGIKKIDLENRQLEDDIFAQENLIESRLKRLENLVRKRKLHGLAGRIDDEESRIG